MSSLTPDYYNTFTSTGSAMDFEIAFVPTLVRVTNLSIWGTPTSASTVVQSTWVPETDNTTYTKSITSSATVYGSITSGGISIENYDGNIFGARAEATAITNANPAVVTDASHGLQTGDVVHINKADGMIQIEGMRFHVTNATTNTFNLTYLNASGFASAATAVEYQKQNFITNSPEVIDIVNVSKARNAVVTFATTNSNPVGRMITFRGFKEFGMTEIEGRVATITSVNTTNNTATVDLDTSGFTVFAFPPSGSAGALRPHAVPSRIEAMYVNELAGNTIAQQSERVTKLRLGSNVVGANDNVMLVEAFLVAHE